MSADLHRTVLGAIGDMGPEAVPVLNRADTDAETRGVTGGRSAHLPSPPRSTWCRLVQATLLDAPSQRCRRLRDSSAKASPLYHNRPPHRDDESGPVCPTPLCTVRPCSHGQDLIDSPPMRTFATLLGSNPFGGPERGASLNLEHSRVRRGRQDRWDGPRIRAVTCDVTPEPDER